MSLWEDVADEAPDALAWLGDAVYADIRTKTRDGHRGREYRGEAFHEAAFHQVKEYEPYARLRATSDVIGRGMTTTTGTTTSARIGRTRISPSARFWIS